MNAEKQYKVSMIVPVYNTSKYLEQCVSSLISQSDRSLEVLLIDDGSTDESGNMCDRLAERDDRIRTFHKVNGGLISSWKYGAERSSGEYLCFVDSDDWVDSRMIEEMLACTTGNMQEIIASDYVIERDDGTSEPIYQQLKPGTYHREALLKEVLPHVLGHERRYVTISRCMKLIARRLILDNMHYCDETIRMGEDLTIMLPCLLDCERLVVMDHKAYYHYRYVTDSMIHQYDQGLYENNKKLRMIIEEIVRDKCAVKRNTVLSGNVYSGSLADTDGKQMPECQQMLSSAAKEYIFLLMLVLKNEARGNPKGYRKNILELCRSEEFRSLVDTTPIVVEQKANQLLYLVMMHPNHLTVSLLRLAMLWYYQKV